MSHPPTLSAAQAALDSFVPRMGRAYASGRNYDLGAGAHKHVSMLSPYVRHRVLIEYDLVSAALGAHGYQSAEKFIQEVFWRTYWKGWLERRPAIWHRYQTDTATLHDALKHGADFAQPYARAISGQTGIDCFDHWVQELKTTGYLHNHARMWFASIWIFTLRLPWQLGADFFLYHLLDGDTASNTLSWRWVAGLQTKGKTYLARADNIATYTEGRFNPVGELSDVAEPLDDEIPPAGDVPVSAPLPAGPINLIVTDDNLSPLAQIEAHTEIEHLIILDSCNEKTPNGISQKVREFITGLQLDLVERAKSRGIRATIATASDATNLIDNAAKTAALYAPEGAGKFALDHISKAVGFTLPRYIPEWDIACYPHCKKGFFVFKKEIPRLISELIR